MTSQTQAQHALLALMRLWMVLFAGAGVTFALFPKQVIGLLNRASMLLHLPFPVLHLEPQRMWLVLTLSLMVTITYLCWRVQRDVTQAKILIPLLLVAKFTSSLFFLFFFIYHLRAFAYLAGLVVDGTIFIVTYMMYKRATV